jgi:ATP-dependent Clp protease ATP-binding subunit ClpC
MTGIPVADILAEDAHSLQRLEAELGKKIFGQEEAVRTVASAIRRAKVGLRHPKRPMASFLFLGPSGVGKTELAKVLSEAVFHDPKALIRLDMSEYAEAFTASKLVGAPAGYVGYRDQTKLSDLVKQRSTSLVLFDELEKAHPDVQNLLLQILEEGELTDATGRRVHFGNTIVVATSNIGLERFASSGIGFSSGETAQKISLTEDIRRELTERFRPELVNRIDHTVIFQPLNPKALEAIANTHLEETTSRLSARKVRLDVHPAVAGEIVSRANRTAGARDIRRLVQTLIEDVVAELLTRPSPPASCVAEVKQKKIIVRPHV